VLTVGSILQRLIVPTLVHWPNNAAGHQGAMDGARSELLLGLHLAGAIWSLLGIRVAPTARAMQQWAVCLMCPGDRNARPPAAPMCV
jgi:hypothetical protein